MTTIEFQAIDWYDYNTTDSKERMVSTNYSDGANDTPDDTPDDADESSIYINKYKFQIFGRTKEGKSVIVTVDDYTPFYFIQIPNNWNNSQLKIVLDGLKKKLPKDLAETLVVDKCKIVKRKIFNGFTNGELFKFIRLVFINTSAIKYSRKIFGKPLRFDGLQPHLFQVYEATLDTILQFMHIRDVKPCGWIKANNCKPNPFKSCVADINVICSFMNISPLRNNTIAGFIRESYDIECICQCTDEGFPNYRRPKDEIIQIGSTYRRYPDKKSYIKYIITQKKCTPIDDPFTKVIEAENEKDLLLKYRDVVNYENPDIRYGYNSHGFDDMYIYERAKLLKIDKEFLRMSRNRYFGSFLRKKELCSSGRGQNILHFIESNGRISIDLMKVIQRDDDLPSYKLNDVAEHYLKQKKNDLDHTQLFANYLEGKPEQIREIAEYCIQDCELLHNIIDHNNVIPNNIAMSNVSIVPLTYIFIRGEGIKIFSLVSDQCKKRDVIIQELDQEDLPESFEGAHVFDPEKPEIFYEPITVMDYNSLYPSIMIAHNFSQDTLVCNPKYDNLPGIKYIEYQYQTKSGNAKTAKYVDHLSNPEFTGVLSLTLKYLLDERAATREQMKVINTAIKNINDKCNCEELHSILVSNERVQNTVQLSEVLGLFNEGKFNEVITLLESKITILDSLQLAFKLCANSIYGQCGSKFSKIRCKPISACVTAQGKKYLNLAKDHVHEAHGAKTIYGDSVTSDTIIPLLDPKGNKLLLTMGQLDTHFDSMWNLGWHTNKYSIDISNLGWMVWSDKGWTTIQRFIKHRTNKAIYSINTDAGCVETTEDHGLLLPDGTEIRPTDLIPNETILMITTDYPIQDNLVNFTQSGTKGVVRQVIKLRENTNEFVYDFETENHHFAAGIGRLIVHNTDSVFVKFNVDHVIDPHLSDEENQYRKREECRRLGIQAANEITKKIGIVPMKIAFEKVCHPLMLLRKKRYMYQKFEFDMRKATFIAMGVLLKRRDNCPIVQKVYRTIVDLLMSHHTMKDVVVYLNKLFYKFKEYNKQRHRLKKEKYNVHLKLFTTSKTLKSRESYKFPERIEHRVLADRMAKRDPGNPPKPNDRIQYVYIKVPDKFDEKGKKIKLLQGDKIETPEYILEHGLEIDYKFYLTNKLKEPLIEILEMDYSTEKTKKIFNKLIERYDRA